jgi:hypothetical protein
MSDNYHKMKNMVNSLADLDYAISDRNKRCDHLHAIIMQNTPFPSFHKVRDDMVLGELTLDPDTPAPPSQALYSNNNHAPPPPALSHLIGNGGQGQGQGRGGGRNHKNRGGNGGGSGDHRRNTSDQGTKG